MATMAQKIAVLSEKLEDISQTCYPVVSNNHQTWQSMVDNTASDCCEHYYIASFDISEGNYTCKYIYDNGDIMYKQRLQIREDFSFWSECYYQGSTNVDVCDLCKDHTNSQSNIDSRGRHVKGVPSYKQSERNYERKDYERPSSPDGERKEFLDDIEYNEVVNTCNQLHKNGVQMPASVKYMGKKGSVMRELYTKCICKKSVKTARWWFQPPRLVNKWSTPDSLAVTDVDTSEEVAREQIIRKCPYSIDPDRPLLSKICTLEKQECDCLCACGHRRI